MFVRVVCMEGNGGLVRELKEACACLRKIYRVGEAQYPSSMELKSSHASLHKNPMIEVALLLIKIFYDCVVWGM
jgi:hypothetical protein